MTHILKIAEDFTIICEVLEYLCFSFIIIVIFTINFYTSQSVTILVEDNLWTQD